MDYSYQKTDSHMKRISDWEERMRKLLLCASREISRQN